MSPLGGPRCPNLRALWMSCCVYLLSLEMTDALIQMVHLPHTHHAKQGMVLTRTAGDWDRKQVDPLLPTSLFLGFVATVSFLSSGGQTGHVREHLGHILRLRALPPPPPRWEESWILLLSFHSFFLHCFLFLLRFRLSQALLTGLGPAYFKVYAWENILGSNLERRMPR